MTSPKKEKKRRKRRRRRRGESFRVFDLEDFVLCSLIGRFSEYAGFKPQIETALTRSTTLPHYQRPFSDLTHHLLKPCQKPPQTPST